MTTVDSPTKLVKTTSLRIIELAKADLAENGWTQGQFYGNADDGKVPSCVQGALFRAVDLAREAALFEVSEGPLFTGSDVFIHMYHVCLLVDTTLREVVLAEGDDSAESDEIETEIPDNSEPVLVCKLTGGRIAEWNDKDGRTTEDVYRLLDKVAEVIKSKGETMDAYQV